ncbi:hypothetical protein L2J10_001924, partial [Campylobacter coli]|nr:hypothetical protein [Campylobacter coli]
MSRVIKINFTDVNFHIKEFQKVYILENCKLYFYKPFHLQTEDKNNGKEFEDKNRTIHKEQEIKKINSQDQLNEKEDITKDYAQKIDKEINKFDENNFILQTKKQRQIDPDNYDIFYDVYTSKDNKDNSVNKKLGCGDGFEVNNGIAEVGAEFFDKCFEKGIYVLIPRLISLDKNEELHFDPVPLEDKGFVVTDFRKGKKGEKNIDLSFQRNIAKIKNPNLTLQSPKEFLQALNENKEFTEDDKKEQAQAIQEACGKKADEITKILLKDDKSLKDVITDKDGLKEKIKELQRKPETNEKLNLLGRLEFLQRNQDKAKDYKKTIKDLQNPQQTSNANKNNTDDNKKKKLTKNNQNQEEQKNKNINSKDIGDAGEYAASMLFT